MPAEQIAARDPRDEGSEDAVTMGQETGAIPLLPAAPQLWETKARFRLNLPIMTLAFKDNHHAAVTIQAGEIIEVTGPAQDHRFVVIDVNGKQFLAFGCDLKDRGELISDRKARSKAQTTTG